MQRVQIDVAEAVDVDLFLRAACEVDQGSFAGAVARAVRYVHSASSTGDVEYAPTALLPENRQQETHKRIWPMEVDLKLLNELLGILKMHLP